MPIASDTICKGVGSFVGSAVNFDADVCSQYEIDLTGIYMQFDNDDVNTMVRISAPSGKIVKDWSLDTISPSDIKIIDGVGYWESTTALSDVTRAGTITFGVDGSTEQDETIDIRIQFAQ